MCYFSKHTINWLKSYLSSRSFLVNLANNFSQHASVFCGVPQGSILGSLSFSMKQHSKVKYLGCLLDEAMYGGATALNFINKMNNKLKYLHRKNSFLTPAFRRLLKNYQGFLKWGRWF